MKRPELNSNLSAADFKDFYWLKEELTAFCKSRGINMTGGKRELADRIVIYLQTGEIVKSVNKQKCSSNFDWNKSTITLNTIITDNYKNTEKVRAFMTKEIGSHFRFNTEFMNWTKQNTGKTMGDAVAEWKWIYTSKQDKTHKTEIAPQFEYNTYIRSFLADNPDKSIPDKSIKEAICYWNLKRNRRGNVAYSREDLELS
jgi:hypothetical protein